MGVLNPNVRGHTKAWENFAWRARRVPGALTYSLRLILRFFRSGNDKLAEELVEGPSRYVPEGAASSAEAAGDLRHGDNSRGSYVGSFC